MKKILGLAALAAFICAAAVYAQSKPVVKGGLKMEDQVVGTGKEATAGRLVSVHYTGWLADKDKNPDKKNKFDSSVGKRPFEFTLGAGQVIKGWDQGVQGMKVGGKRRLTIAPELGYGERGAGGVIPGGATLVFDVELLDVK